ncbi:tRNA (guanosine(46)-N7)-methyltransferase TrmB [Mycoplasmopsis canis]|uniref:tRNA (guanosine(46)-N7)-methyltransferase TrmB n=1 Tax=Mycoplasmopsis cynos TaxID=171284 RepID=UPI002AFED5C2|nr:tRNA (guanosine(46)-N7)-methyltransferase TrmB [Mycoplasmopsis cynos]WQQ12909.1 tRNA (guanosine(46)-N7)-methyltransferase TrmB [Mycoplasmopsis cynos]WQQ13798.1 tRNA (guanosine(46)-N7)-methyltransferase TrmB [Mycoplasmopsis cynos]
MRLRFDNTALDKLQQSPYYLTNFPINLSDTDLIEIGAGKGEMISQMALNEPNRRFFAIEKYPTVANKILNKINELQLKNLFIITKDANDLNEIFNNKTSTIWLTFSDPWPKNAHEKRRLTYKNFLDIYQKLLTNDGNLYFKTDNDKLFEYSINSLTENDWEIIFKTTDLHNSKYNKSNYQTGYEKKWSALGKNINFLIAKYKG